MFEYLSKLRKKPVAERRRFAFILTLSVTGVIFLAWFYGFTGKLARLSSEEEVQNVAGPTAVIGESFNDLRESLNEAKNVIPGLFKF